MPIYEDQCERCNQTFETMQKFSDEPLHVHEGCGGSVHRLLSAPALQFKGSGWYITDYARKNTTSAEGKSGSNGPSTGGDSKDTGTKSSTDSAKPETKSDSKPAAKSDTK